MPTTAETFTDIDLPFFDARPEAGSLLSVARPIDDATVSAHIGMGVEWLPLPPIDVKRDEVNCDVVYDKDVDIRAILDEVSQPAFLMWDRMKNSTGGLDLAWLVNAVTRGIVDETVFTSATLAAELEDAAGSGGFGLIGNATYTPTVVTSGASAPRVAFARLERYLAVTAGRPGMRGVIHTSPDVFVLAVADDLVFEKDGMFRTATGHYVVADAGHSGVDAPYGQSDAAAGNAWIYATGDVWYALSAEQGVTRHEDEDGGPFYKARNQNQPLVERYGIVAFDPNVHAAALVSTSATSGVDGGGA